MQSRSRHPKNKDLNTWVDSWDVLYQTCKTAKIVEVAQDRPVFDFLAAVRPLAPSFADVWLELYLTYLRSPRCSGTTDV